MMLKKFYGKSVEEARKKAQGSLGQTYIVVETKEANGEEPAWIHVLDEETGSPSQEKGSVTYSRRDLFPKALNKLKETVSDSLQLFNLDSPGSATPRAPGSTPGKKQDQKDERYLPYRSVAAPNAAHTSRVGARPENEPAVDLSEDFRALSRRFERLEAIVSEQMLGANARYVSHPAFQQLMASGVPRPLVTTWFNELMNEGIDPFSHKGDFTRLLGQKVRQALDVVASDQPARFMIFTGLSGSGKSSLIMKLALHPEFLASASCALISVVPEGVKNCYPPLEAFASEHDFIHFKIGTQSQWNELQDELAEFDHVLVEMPSAELHRQSAGFTTAMLREVIANTASMEVHHVINAALNPENITDKAFNDFTFDYLNFTHLDAAPKKGHLLPLMQLSGCRVRYTSAGLRIPEDIDTFKPERFARQLLSTI